LLSFGASFSGGAESMRQREVVLISCRRVGRSFAGLRSPGEGTSDDSYRGQAILSPAGARSTGVDKLTAITSADVPLAGLLLLSGDACR
jgi:hypothetical protein